LWVSGAALNEIKVMNKLEEIDNNQVFEIQPSIKFN
jgi:hypothetical protein